MQRFNKYLNDLINSQETFSLPIVNNYIEKRQLVAVTQLTPLRRESQKQKKIRLEVGTVLCQLHEEQVMLWRSSMFPKISRRLPKISEGLRRSVE